MTAQRKYFVLIPDVHRVKNQVLNTRSFLK